MQLDCLEPYKFVILSISYKQRDISTFGYMSTSLMFYDFKENPLQNVKAWAELPISLKRTSKLGYTNEKNSKKNK